MKIKFVFWISLLAMASLLGFQVFVIIDSFNSKKDAIQENISAIIRKSINEEVQYRLKKKELIESGLSTEEIIPEELTTFSDGRRGFIANAQELAEAGPYQQELKFQGYYFDLHVLDSIFESTLHKEKIAGQYALFYCDSTGALIEQVGNLPAAKTDRAFHTDAVLIVDGKRVQAVVDITMPIVFKRMLGLVISSFLVLVILFFSTAYLLRTIFTQSQLQALRTNFINVYIHNIKSPLGTLKNVILQFMSDDFDQRPEKKEYFGQIAMRQIETMLSQIGQILMIAKHEEKKLIPHRTETDIEAMIEDLKKKFSTSQEKHVTFKTSYAIDIDKKIFLDGFMISDAVSNLIDNSIKYSGDSVTIDISCYSEKDTLQIRVRDNGFGIDKKYHPTIFDKFERGDSIKRNESKGFGLGLNFVKCVIEAHGGLISLCSYVGKGSEFTLSLPIKSNHNAMNQ